MKMPSKRNGNTLKNMAAKPKIISIQFVPEQKCYLALTDEGKLFRSFELKPEGTAWEEISNPDFSKTQPKISRKATSDNHNERAGK